MIVSTREPWKNDTQVKDADALAMFRLASLEGTSDATLTLWKSTPPNKCPRRDRLGKPEAREGLRVRKTEKPTSAITVTRKDIMHVTAVDQRCGHSSRSTL